MSAQSTNSPNQHGLKTLPLCLTASFLTSFIGRAEVHLVTPGPGNSSTEHLAAAWPDKQAVLGISELSENVFAVAVGNLTSSNIAINNTFAIWKINVCGDRPVTEKIADPASPIQGVNGMAALHDRLLLLADSWSGNLFALDIASKSTKVVLSDATTAVNYSAPIPIGINGLKVYKGYVYYSNFADSLLARARISASGEIIGQPAILAAYPDLHGPDDLAVSRDGSVYLAGPLSVSQGGDKLLHVTLDGKVTIVAEGGAVAGNTGVALGRTHANKHVVYVSTMGGFGADGLPKAGGQVAAVSLE